MGVALALCKHRDSSGFQAGFSHHLERSGAMRQALAIGGETVLLLAGHLAERARLAVWQEHRIVTEAGGPPRRPDQRAVDAALEFLGMPVGPGEAERGNEPGAPLLRREGVALAKPRLDLLHGMVEVAPRPRPARGVNARR